MYLFIGQMIPDDMMDWYIEHSKTIIPVSSETHQRAIISGLMNTRKVFIINKIPAGFFPVRFDKTIISRKSYDDIGICVKQSTIPVLRVGVLIRNMFYECRKMIETENIEGIFVYMPFVAFSVLIKKLKKKYKKIPVVAIVPDLVKHSYRKEGCNAYVFLKKKIREFQNKAVKRNLRDVDGFVYLSEQMKYEFGVGRQYIVMESIYEPFEMTVYHKKKKKSLTYCGKITEENGVERLVNSFMNIKNEDWNLIICGEGNLLKRIKEISKNDERIVYTGQVSHEEVIKIELESTVLVNPRYTNIENAAYSFPSKLIEYMACGKPVISSRLDGIPKEYDDYLIFIKDDMEESLKESIISVMSLSDAQIDEMGIANARFVKENKSANAQGKRLVNFIENLRT